jgi:hypothetical protein
MAAGTLAPTQTQNRVPAVQISKQLPHGEAAFFYDT